MTPVFEMYGNSSSPLFWWAKALLNWMRLALILPQVKSVESPERAINQANTSSCFGDADTNASNPKMAQAKIPTNGLP